MNLYVLIAAVIVGLLVGAIVWWFTRSHIRALLAAVGLIGLVAAMLPWDVSPKVQPDAMPTLAVLRESRPIEEPTGGYVTSDRCRECHRRNHATWHASYHRTMTQVATPKTVLGDFDDVRLSHGGRDYHLQRDQEMCWVEMADPSDPSPHAKRIELPVVMSTGSHHMQVYWLGTGLGRTTDMLPFVFLKESKEWIPRSSAFLRCKEITRNQFGRWSMGCSQCHSTQPRERLQPSGVWDTEVAEFGISCEACHGPGEDHIRYHRLSASQEDESPTLPADPIINPENLTHERSSQVCGQCHSVRDLIEHPDKVNIRGHSYRPGDDLFATHQIWQRDSPRIVQALQMDILREEAENELARRFYVDGMIRVSGREYNGLLDSACYERGEMSCLSCHRLHQSESDTRPRSEWADDQLQADAIGDAACLKCHSSDRFGSDHTHHAVGSPGSTCYNCHMPHTTYGLLKAIRNHTISSPDIGRDVAAKRPNACNQCHLDKTLEWSANHLQTWYGVNPPSLDQDQRDIAASLVWLIKGDAAERALAAWTMSWPEAQQTSGTHWQAPFLARLLDDPYPAVRLIARRTLRTLPGFQDLPASLLASPSDRAAVDSALQRWHSQSHANNRSLMIKDGSLHRARLDGLLEQRDQTPIDLAE